MQTIELKHIAGYATERVVWRMMQEMATVTSQEIDVWNIGSAAFYALMGVEVLNGANPSTQTETTPIPKISSSHCSPALSGLIEQCLNYNPHKRPSREDVLLACKRALSNSPEVPRRLTNLEGKKYHSSLIKFWPESMTRHLILILLLTICGGVQAQMPKEITSELSVLVERCILLREKKNKPQVEYGFVHDTKWTLMDELAIDRRGECSTREKVTTFGLNEMAYKIAKRHRGVNNAGGRFRNGQDERYEYSLLEVTARRKAKLEYHIPGREGLQVFAVVPRLAEASFSVEATLDGNPVGKKIEKDGVVYVIVDVAVKPANRLHLNITNNSRRNMAFVIINHNTRRMDK